MCGRITQRSNPKVLGLKIATLVEPLFEAPPRYNGAPSHEHWVIRPVVFPVSRPLSAERNSLCSTSFKR
jgi:myo-inositol catabolism protein IolC